MGKKSAVTTFLIASLFVHELFSYSHEPAQYHIQTDMGPNRYFRFQTYDGQYRKEKRLDDGSVVGSYGWVDPTGLLRQYDYIADTQGYRIARTRIRKVDQPQEEGFKMVNYSDKVSYKGQHHFPASSSIRKTWAISNLGNSGTTTTTTTTTTPTTKGMTTDVSTSPSTIMPIVVEETTLYPKLKVRPLFVGKRKPQNSKDQNKITKRRENYNSVRQQMKLKLKEKHLVEDSDTARHFESISKPSRKPTTREQVFLPAVLSPKDSNPTFLPSESESTPDFGYDNTGGRVSIDFDIGNQYRKEKLFYDGTVSGEHGYVDPMGILRITYYKSGGLDGQQEFKKNLWVGKRLPGQKYG